MENHIIESVELSNVLNRNRSNFQYKVMVKFKTDNNKPFRIDVAEAILKDENGNRIDVYEKGSIPFPVGLLKYTRPKYFFHSNGESLSDGAVFIITVIEQNASYGYRFTYLFESGIGKLIVTVQSTRKLT